MSQCLKSLVISFISTKSHEKKDVIIIFHEELMEIGMPKVLDISFFR